MAELFHITERAAWTAAAESGEYRISTRHVPLDQQGFIHCSLRHQLRGVAEQLYGDADDLVVLVIDSAQVPAPVRYEAPATGSERYPHIYGPVPTGAVTQVIPVTRDATGRLVLPEQQRNGRPPMSSAYLSSRDRAGQRFPPRLFRTVQLNAAGRAAVSLLCLAAAGAGYAVAGTHRAAGMIAAAGTGVGALLALIVADRHRWRQMTTGYSWTEDPREIARVASLLRDRGVPVHVRTDPEGRPQLRFRVGYERRVRNALDRAGW